MDFVIRDAADFDLNQCSALVTDRFLYDVGQLAALEHMWSHIIASKCGLANVIADARAPSRVVQFGMAVFVSDESADRYHSCTRPKIGYGMVQEWTAGRYPFLEREGIAHANAGTGLNLVVIHHGYAEPPDDESMERLRSASYEQAMMSMRGWNLRSYTNKIFARNPLREGKEMGEALGFRLGQYSKEQLSEAGIPEHKAPWVWMATREDAAVGPVGLPLGVLFHTFSPPRFGFVFSEQEMLKLALDGHTDESISSVMCASIAMTKKRFRAIYEKVQNSTGGWEILTLSEPSASAVRGVEMRRHLLNYLREHPEELHPYSLLPPKAIQLGTTDVARGL